jgi:hypothetical protein
MYHRHTLQMRSSACSTVGLAGGGIHELFQRTASAATVKASAKAHGYRGTAINTTREPIQAVITVNGKKTTKVKVVDPARAGRSQVLDDRASPFWCGKRFQRRVRVSMKSPAPHRSVRRTSVPCRPRSRAHTFRSIRDES